MKLFVSNQFVKGGLQVLDKLTIKGIVHLCPAHSDSRNFALEGAFHADVCIRHRKVLPVFSYTMDWQIVARNNYHILNTPKGVSGIGAFSDAAMPRASTVRVSRGSIMPSSHRRAVL